LAKLRIWLRGSARWSSMAFSRMSQRSNFLPHLHSFKLGISNGPSAQVDVDSLLASTPHGVRHINLSFAFTLHSGTIAGLASGRICPNLEKFELYYASGALDFLEMLRVRQENAQLYSNGGGDRTRVKAFTSVRICAGDRKPDKADFLIQLLQKSGVAVKVRWGWCPGINRQLYPCPH
jgi:hypothetical protein